MVISAPVLQIMKLKQISLSKVVHLLSGRVVEHCIMVKWDENLEEKSLPSLSTRTVLLTVFSGIE